MVDEIKPIAELVGAHAEYRKGAAYVVGLDVLPLARVVNDEKVTDHHAIIPTRSEHNLEKMGSDDRRIYDMAVRRFLAVFHPEAVFENTRVETTVAAAEDARMPSRTCSARAARLLIVPGWRGVYDEISAEAKAAEAEARGEEDEETDQQLPRLIADEQVQTREVESARKETKPPRRYSDASLLGAMETAGKLVDDDELREAMKDSGIGTPATRAAIIERLITVGYVERDGRALVATEKGLNVIRLLERARADLAGTDRQLGAAAGEDRARRGLAQAVHERHRRLRAGDRRRSSTRRSKTCASRARGSGPCPVCGHEIVENRKGYSCWAREDPGCGFVIWKAKAGKTLPLAIARELIKTGYTEQAVTGFRGRSGRSFRAHLALQQTDEGKWRVEFDELWAKEGAKPPEAEGEAEARRRDAPP